MASEFNADDILEVSTSGFTSGPASGPLPVSLQFLSSVENFPWFKIN